MGYKFQFITLAGFHSLNYSMFELAHGYARDNMTAFVEMQNKEFAAAEKGFTAVKHQREVGGQESGRRQRLKHAVPSSQKVLNAASSGMRLFFGGSSPAHSN
jgi:isocitrate lyase